MTGVPSDFEHDIIRIDVVITESQAVNVLNSTSDTDTGFRINGMVLIPKQIGRSFLISGETKRGDSAIIGQTADILCDIWIWGRS